MNEPDLKRTRRNGQPPTRLIERLPPHDLEAEIGVLGCILMDSAVAIPECDIICAEDLYDLRHREVFSHLLAMHDEGIPIDMLTVNSRLRDKGKIEAIGGIAYLSSLPDLVPSVHNVGQYAKIVWEKARLRRFIRVGTDIVGKA